MFDSAYNRLPIAAETARALSYLVRFESLLAGRGVPTTDRPAAAWAALAQATLAASEFITVD